MNHLRLFLIIGINLLALHSRGQSFEWWARVVNWDGISHWTKYINTQPGLLGPNALPVPYLSNGSIDSLHSISLTGSFHFSKGDKTQNPVLYGNYCLVEQRISFDVSWVPYEHFAMSHAVKEKRHVFSHFYYDNDATGEVHLNTNIQLLNRWRKHIGLALRIGYRFPTSSGFGMARYSDAPGYYFDLSFGKPFHDQSLKWIGMLGFYAWQVNSDEHRQNDAFLFGTGLEWNRGKLRIQSYVAGYLGYMDQAVDDPIVFRLGVEKNWKQWGMILRYQEGLHDFNYSSLELGAKFRFK